GEGELVGTVAAPADPQEATGDRAIPKAVAAPGPAPDPRSPDQPARTVATSGLTDDICPACDSAVSQVLFESTDRLYGTTDRIFRVVECSACRLIRLSPWPSPSELRQYYPDTYWHAPGTSTADKLEEWYRRFVLSDHVRFVRGAIENCGTAGPVLDVGCGGGLLLRM